MLLKRYLSSQAFVNVAAALAQYFRRMVSGRPVQLDIESLTEHIGGWMLEEVLILLQCMKQLSISCFLTCGSLARDGALC